jgi:hypothetical protein
MKHTLATTCRDTQRANAFIGERRLVFVRAKLLPPLVAGGAYGPTG